ncbi:MAG: hypothetical protein KatS3mg060_2716 [Dehalococcoidia bacterium]|nr:MAG: hypothetical protein KatS3mg060_2716 [Dehalococcoidia bacterium]
MTPRRRPPAPATPPATKSGAPGVLRAAAGRYRLRQTPSDQIVIIAPYLTTDACVFKGDYFVDFSVYALSFTSSFQIDQTLVQPLYFKIPFDYHNDDLVSGLLSLTSGTAYADIEPAARPRASQVSIAQEQPIYLIQSGDPYHPVQSAVLEFAPDWSRLDIDNYTPQLLRRARSNDAERGDRGGGLRGAQFARRAAHRRDRPADAERGRRYPLRTANPF